MKTILLIVVY